MTKTKALALGTVIAINAVGFIAVHWWIVSLIALLAAGYCFWLFVSKFRRDRRLAARSNFQRVIPHTRFIEPSDHADLSTANPFLTNEERS